MKLFLKYISLELDYTSLWRYNNHRETNYLMKGGEHIEFKGDKN